MGDLKNKSATLHEIAGICVRRGDLDGAMKIYQQVLDIVDGLGFLEGRAATLHSMVHVYIVRGELDGAMTLYKQSPEITEGLGDLQGKAVTFADMAYILHIRHDLEGAIKLYQQSFEIKEGMGDLKGKASTLATLGQLLVESKDYLRAIRALVESLQTYSSIGARSNAEGVAEILINVQQRIGIENFDNAWKEITDSPMPEWLMRHPEQEQDMTAEQFIVEAIQSAREKRPKAKQYFKEVQRMATDSSISVELCELGRVLSRIMVGDTKVDLSGLPEEWAKVVLMSMQT